MTQEHIRKKLKEWAKLHPDVWHKNEHGVAHWWFVVNALGTLLGWPEWFGEVADEIKREDEKPQRPNQNS